MSLTAFVLGSGFAGQGHAMALRDCGVEIVGMASRTEEVVSAVASELDIAYSTTDWRTGLTETQPDIVAVGTPGGAHFDPVMMAIARGCHVFCDKPLAPTAYEAKELHFAAKLAGVKTAYAASFCFMPAVLQAKEMVANGDIGEPQEVEAISHFGLNPLIPFGWSHTLEQGGGRLNNNFPHKLAVVLNVLGGEVSAVSGTTRADLKRAPVVEGVHHFRERHGFAPESADEPGLEWKDGDSDWAYTVLAQIALPGVTEPASALFKHSGLQPRVHPDYMAFFGSEGVIHIEGHYGHGPLHYRSATGPIEAREWVEVPTPAHIHDAQPAIDDHTQRNWNLLAKEFVADLRGEDCGWYPTFRDGWLYQEIIDVIRADKGWTDVTELTKA